MKIHIPSMAAGLVLLAGAGVAYAQDAVIVPEGDVIVVPADPVVPPGAVVITPEQRTIVREYVEREPIVSLDLPGFDLNIGSPLPDTVELHAIDVPEVEYQYVVIDDRTVLVDPQTRQIVEVLD